MLVPSPETDEEREERELAEYHAREARAAKRERHSGWAKGQPRCGACRLFISTPGALCACGFDNGCERFAAAA